MKLIQAMKQLKDLRLKADDLRDKVERNCSMLSTDTSPYKDPVGQVKNWMQSHSDVLKEILRLRFCIQRTNLLTPVTIELDGKQVTKTIAEWIYRRRDLATLELDVWRKLTDRGLKEMQVASTVAGQPPTKITIVRNFVPEERDKMQDLLRREPSLIDAHLEIVNAVTDLIEEKA